MARCSNLALLLLLVLLVPTFAGAASAAGQGLTHLHFYFHEVEAGSPNATVVNVASLHRYVTLTLAASTTSPAHEL